jgi:hypothetical protein
MTLREFQDLCASLAATPEKVRSLVDDLTDEELSWKPTDQDFSVLEHVCHLSDIEREGYAVRIEKLLNEEQPFLPDIDGGRLAAERKYNSQNLAPPLNAFSRSRKQNVHAVGDLPLDRLSRSGMFETVGPVTLGKLLSMMLEHDRDHLRALSDLRQRLHQRR